MWCVASSILDASSQRWSLFVPGDRLGDSGDRIASLPSTEPCGFVASGIGVNRGLADWRMRG